MTINGNSDVIKPCIPSVCSVGPRYTKVYPCTFHLYSNVINQISPNALSTNACWCIKKAIYGVCVCSRDTCYPLAKTRGLSSCTYAQTIQ